RVVDLRRSRSGGRGRPAPQRGLGAVHGIGGWGMEDRGWGEASPREAPFPTPAPHPPTPNSGCCFLALCVEITSSHGAQSRWCVRTTYDSFASLLGSNPHGRGGRTLGRMP